MKLSQFDDIDAADDLARCQYMLDKSPDGIVYVQEKINGVSARFWKEYSIIHAATRNDKQFAPLFFGDIINKELFDLFRHLPEGAQILGELYMPGVPLATIAGYVNVKRKVADDMFLQHGELHIYDIITPTAMKFSARSNHLVQFFGGVADSPPPTLEHLRYVHWLGIDNAMALNEMFEERVACGHEGVVYRVDPCLHYPGDSPSPHAWKRTATHTAEGRCISVAQGMGKRRGMMGAMYLRLDNATTIAVGGGKDLDDAMLTRLYQDPPIGQMVTFSYKELSINGTPLRPQLVAVRNYE